MQSPPCRDHHLANPSQCPSWIGHTLWKPQSQVLQNRQLTSVTPFHTDPPFWSGQISLKSFKSSSGRWLSIGMQYLQLWPLVLSHNYKHSKLRTILHVIYLPVAFLQTSFAQSSSQSSIPLRLPTQIHRNHETHNRHDWRKQSHPQCCVRHAGSSISSNQRMLLHHQPLWMGPVRSGQDVKQNLQTDKTAFSPRPYPCK